MKKIYLLIPVIFIALFANAQTLVREVVASGGNYISSSTGSISYTIGETVTTTLPGGTNIITQGFQQPDDTARLIAILDVEKDGFGAFVVYPVPTTDKLWYAYEFSTEGEVKVEMFNLLGQKLDYTNTEPYTSGKSVHSFDCTAYAVGNYVLSATFTAKDLSQKVFTKKFLIIN